MGFIPGIKTGGKTSCKGRYTRGKAQKACKMGKSNKASCYQTAQGSKKKKCSFNPSKAHGQKTKTDRKLVIVGGIIAVIVILLIGYSLFKGVGFVGQHPEILEAAAA